MTKKEIRRKTKTPFNQKSYQDSSDIEASDDENERFSVSMLSETLNHPQYLDSDAQFRSADHLFEVLRDMFPCSTIPELRDVWEKYRPDLEAAVCHLLAKFEQSLPEVVETMAIDNNDVLCQDVQWPELGRANEERRSGSWRHLDETYRDRLLKGSGGEEDMCWDFGDDSHDNASEASFESAFSCVSSSVVSSSSQVSYSSTPPNASHF
jgi:hypothetical protein